jgi:hypothetical protein
MPHIATSLGTDLLQPYRIRFNRRHFVLIPKMETHFRS